MICEVPEGMPGTDAPASPSEIVGVVEAFAGQASAVEDRVEYGESTARVEFGNRLRDGPLQADETVAPEPFHPHPVVELA